MEECHTKWDHCSDKHQIREQVIMALILGLCFLSTYLVNPAETEAILVVGKRSNWDFLMMTRKLAEEEIEIPYNLLHSYDANHHTCSK